MKTTMTILVALMLVFTACGDDDSAGAAETCDVLVDDGLELFQDTLDAFSEMSMEDLAAMGDEPPPAVQDLETRGDELEARSEELGCSEAEMQEAFLARIGELEAEGPVGEFFLETLTQEIESGSFFEE